jgi:hypothetical protein
MHKREKPGKVPVVLIEAQTGACPEDDTFLCDGDMHAHG